MLLAEKNSHVRDKYISFKEENHEYTIEGMNTHPVSVTTIIHRYFPEFQADIIIARMMSSYNWPQSKYHGKTPEVIKEEWKQNGNEASRLGTIMHKSIEQFLNNDPIDTPNSKEFLMFQSFWRQLLSQYPMLKPYRSEWIVYDEDIMISGSIDCVLEDNNGNLVILDWKRSKEIKMSNKEKGYYPFNNFDNCNYHTYTLQLNFYRHILETKYGKNIIFMMLVVLHPNQESYICHPVDRIDLSAAWPVLASQMSTMSMPGSHK